MRVEENSEVQRMGERRARCGEIRTGMGCGEGPAKNGEGGLFGLPCSRNARPQKALVGRAQWETKQATLP